MVFNLRAWGEMNLAMFSYYLSLYVGKQTYGKAMNIFLKVVEIIGYCVPVIFGVIPSKPSIHTFFMGATALLTFCAILLPFPIKVILFQVKKQIIFLAILEVFLYRFIYFIP